MKKEAGQKKEKKKKVETPQDRLKMEVASELGLAEKVKKLGWGGLTAAESGRLGGIMTRRLKKLRQEATETEG